MQSLITHVHKIDPAVPQPELIKEAAQVLQTGGLVAFPTETVYGLGANAFDARAVERIFAAKGRPASDPIIVHLYDLGQLSMVAVDVPDIAYELAQHFWPGPLTFILRRNPNVPANVSAGKSTIAVRMPSHPVAVDLLRTADVPVAAPSANRFARPSATTAAHVLEDLNGRVDVILDGGAASIGVESTILDLTKEVPIILRPGGVTIEALREFVPNILVVSKHLHENDAGIEAPGMLTKHYSPHAELLLYSGLLDNVIPAMRGYALQQISQNKKVGVLLSDNERMHFADLPLEVVNLGVTQTQISHNLFNAMRLLDQARVDVILVHGFGQAGLGAALWDRLLRAAEGHVIEC